VAEIRGLRVKSLQEKMSLERLKLPKPEVPEVYLHHRSEEKRSTVGLGRSWTRTIGSSQGWKLWHGTKDRELPKL
jgi:hypothetical protein